MEGGYCSDTQFEEKSTQRLYSMKGWLEYPKCTGMMCGWDLLGYAGTTYTNDMSVLQEFGLNRSAARTVLKRLHLHAISCLHKIIKERRYFGSTMVDMQCKLEEEEETRQASPAYSTPFCWGSLVYYQASHKIDAKRCSLFSSFLVTTNVSGACYCGCDMMQKCPIVAYSQIGGLSAIDHFYASLYTKRSH